MIRAIVTIGLILFAAGADDARAEIEYPYCVVPGRFNGGTCSYSTLEQCQATVSASAGFCAPNPHYVGPATPRQVRGKR